MTVFPDNVAHPGWRLVADEWDVKITVDKEKG